MFHSNREKMLRYSICHYFTPVLQVSLILYGVSLSLSVSAEENVTGAVGRSVNLPSGVQSVSVQDIVLMDWKYKGKAIVDFSGGKTNPDLSPQFRRRIQMSNQSGDLRLTHLRLDDSGTYTFTGIRKTGAQIPTKIINLQVYEPIDGIKIRKEVKWIQSMKACSISLQCSLTNGSNVSYTWERNHEPINSSYLDKDNIKDYIIREDANFTCIATNPIGNKTETTIETKCSQEIETWRQMIYIYIGVAASILVLLIIVAVAALVCCRRKKSKATTGSSSEPTTVYAEIERQSTMKKHSSPSTIYDTVDDQLHPSRPTPSRTLPQTLYDTVAFNRAENPSQYQQVL